MRRRLFAAAALALRLLAVLAVPAAAQQPATSSLAFSERSIEVDGYLQRGQELEGQRRWGEALAHYEEGLRQFPDGERRWRSASSWPGCTTTWAAATPTAALPRASRGCRPKRPWNSTRRCC